MHMFNLGSLTNLAKCPASTVQILGAVKALFRALKTRGNTPKVQFLNTQLTQVLGVFKISEAK